MSLKLQYDNCWKSLLNACQTPVFQLLTYQKGIGCVRHEMSNPEPIVSSYQQVIPSCYHSSGDSTTVVETRCNIGLAGWTLLSGEAHIGFPVSSGLRQLSSWSPKVLCHRIGPQHARCRMRGEGALVTPWWNTSTSRPTFPMTISVPYLRPSTKRTPFIYFRVLQELTKSPATKSRSTRSLALKAVRKLMSFWDTATAVRAAARIANARAAWASNNGLVAAILDLAYPEASHWLS